MGEVCHPLPGVRNKVSFISLTQKTVNEYYHLDFRAWRGTELRLGKMDFNTMGVLASTCVGENSKIHDIGYTGQSDTNDLMGMIDSVEVIFSSISKDFFEYMKSYNQYETTRDDWTYFQVYPVYSNIEGGAGIFGVVSRQRYGIKKGR